MSRLTPNKSGKKGRRGSRGDGRGSDSRLAQDVKALDMSQYTTRGIGDLFESERPRSSLPVSPSQSRANRAPPANSDFAWATEPNH